MRWQMSCRCVARVVLWGKTSDYSGRMPGILEEAVLALALGQPLYVLGACDGAARVVGKHLGLASDWNGNSGFAAAAVDATSLQEHRHLFQPPGIPGLPLTLEEALSYLAARAIGGPGWTDNGLTVAQNRELFAETDGEKICRLLRRGLLRIFGE